MLTIYDTEGKVILRNLAAKKVFDISELETNDEMFLPYLNDRELANTIFSEV